MKINSVNVNIDDIVNINEKSFLKRINNNLLLSDNDIIILDKYNIPYTNCKDMKELVFHIMEILNENDYSDLEELSIKLSEFNYYNNTNK